MATGLLIALGIAVLSAATWLLSERGQRAVGRFISWLPVPGLTMNQWIAVAALVAAAWMFRFQPLDSAGTTSLYLNRWTGAVFFAGPGGHRELVRTLPPPPRDLLAPQQ